MKTPEPSKENPSAPSKRKFNAKSTATAAQYDRIVSMLRAGEKSTFDFRRAGICAPAARIKELNDRHGYSIPRVDLRDLYDSDGYRHQRIAIYRIEREPAGA